MLISTSTKIPCGGEHRDGMEHTYDDLGQLLTETDSYGNTVRDRYDSEDGKHTHKSLQK